VCYYCFFTDCRIHLFSSLAARLFNKLTRYSLLAPSPYCKVPPILQKLLLQCYGVQARAAFA